VVGTTLVTAGVRRPTRKGCPNHAVEFKRRLAAAACKAEISVAKLALEHSVNANQLFKWGGATIGRGSCGPQVSDSGS
jgi:hypothetical protein